MALIPRFRPIVDGSTVFLYDVPNGSVIRVEDLMSELKELRSQYLSDPDDKRRQVVEKIMGMLRHD